MQKPLLVIKNYVRRRATQTQLDSMKRVERRKLIKNYGDQVTSNKTSGEFMTWLAMAVYTGSSYIKSVGFKPHNPELDLSDLSPVRLHPMSLTRHSNQSVIFFISKI